MASSQPRAREPLARADFAAVSSSRHMFIWGGWVGRNDSRIATSTVELFDVLSAAWQEPQQLGGLSLPDRLDEMAVAWDEEKAYSFGGSIESTRKYINDVYEINLSTLQCTKLVPATGSAPSPRDASAMVCSKRRLVIYGGSKYDEGHQYEEQFDDLHVFNLDTSESCASLVEYIQQCVPYSHIAQNMYQIQLLPAHLQPNHKYVH